MPGPCQGSILDKQREMLKEIVNEKLHSIESKSKAQPSNEAASDGDEFAAAFSPLLGNSSPLHADLLQELTMLLALAQPTSYSPTDISEALSAFDQGKGLLRALKVFAPGAAWQESAKKLLENMGAYTEMAGTAKSTLASLTSLSTRFEHKPDVAEADGRAADPATDDDAADVEDTDGLVATMSVEDMDVEAQQATIEKRFAEDWQVAVAAAKQYMSAAQQCRQSRGCNRTVEKELGKPISCIVDSLLSVATAHFLMPVACFWTCGMASVHNTFKARKLTKTSLAKNPVSKEKEKLCEIGEFSLKRIKEARRLICF